jgi:hypothetical protein
LKEKGAMTEIQKREQGIDESGNEYINLEPHWCKMFDRAIDRAYGADIDEGSFQLIKEMLKYGKRLNARFHCIDCRTDASHLDFESCGCDFCEDGKTKWETWKQSEDKTYGSEEPAYELRDCPVCKLQQAGQE